MAKYRNRLPQLGNKPFVTDAGLETILIFLENRDLPGMAAFTLLRDDEGIDRLRSYYNDFVALAHNYGMGCILETATWRAHQDWAGPLGITPEDIDAANKKGIELLAEIRNEAETSTSPIVLSGNLGPRGDGYNPSKQMGVDEAQEYHSRQLNIFVDSEADMISAFTMNYLEEALGIVKAAQQAQMPVVIAFTVETDGRLPTGQTLEEAISAIDSDTGVYPAYYMINCAHPTHFAHEVNSGGPWVQRVRGLRANSSSKSHEELDNSTELDDGNPAEFGQQYAELVKKAPHINVFGGCCGTDLRHVKAAVEEISALRK